MKKETNILQRKGKRIFERDADDSSDEEKVEEKIFGKGSSEVGDLIDSGYDLEAAWINFAKPDLLRSQTIGLIDHNLTALAHQYFDYHGINSQPILFNGAQYNLDRTNIVQFINQSQEARNFICNQVFANWINNTLVPQYQPVVTENLRKAFVAHAFGTGALYSREENSRYYGDETRIGIKDYEFRDEEIRESVKETLKSGVNYAIEETSKNIYRKFINKIISEKDFFGQVSSFLSTEEIDGFVESLGSVSGNLFGTSSNSESIYKAFMESGSKDGSKEKLKEFVELSFFKTQTEKGMGFGDEFSKFITEQQDEIIPRQSLQSRDNFADYVTQYARHSGVITTPQNGMVKSRVTMGIGIAGEIIDFVNRSDPSSVRREIMSPILHNALSGLASSKSSYFSEDSIVQKVRNEDLAMAADKLDVVKCFHSEFQTNFQKYISCNLPARRNFGHGHKFEIKKPLDFLDAVRTTNRSDSRLMRNYLDAHSTDDITKFNYDLQFHRLGVIHKSDGKRIQYSGDRFSKTELIFGGDGSYPAISQKITQLKQQHGFTDRDLANFVRYACGHDLGLDQRDSMEKIDHILHSPDLNRTERRSFLKEIAEISVLLFYGETMRNTASFATHQMMLDLIVSGNRSWEYFLSNPKAMPMAPEGAVPEARATHNLFRNSMPWHYKYDGDETAPYRMIDAEGRLYSEWLNCKGVSPEFAEEALLMSYREWFGIEMSSVTYGNSTNQQLRNPAIRVLEKMFAGLTSIPEKIFSKNDFELITSVVESFECKLTDYGKTQLASVIFPKSNQIVDLEGTAEAKEKLLTTLAKRQLIDSNYYDQEVSDGLILSSAYRKNRELFRYLISQSNDESLSFVGKASDTALMWTVRNGWFEEAIKIIPRLSVESLNQHYKVPTFDNEKTSMSFVAESNFKMDQKMLLCKTLIENGAEVDEKTKQTDFYFQNKSLIDGWVFDKKHPNLDEELAKELDKKIGLNFKTTNSPLKPVGQSLVVKGSKSNEV